MTPQWLIEYKREIDTNIGKEMVWIRSSISDEYDNTSEREARNNWQAYNLDTKSKYGIHYRLICVYKDVK